MLSPEICLRPMHLDDLDQICNIERLSFPTPWEIPSFVRELTENPVARYIVMESQGQIIAYAGVWLLLDEGHITNIAVHPAYRGRGWGREIVMNLLKLCACSGIRAVTLEVRPSNAVALKLYAGLGFRVTGVRKGYYTDTKEDALLMWKEEIDQIAVSEEECRDVFGVHQTSSN